MNSVRYSIIDIVKLIARVTSLCVNLFLVYAYRFTSINRTRNGMERVIRRLEVKMVNIWLQIK